MPVGRAFSTEFSKKMSVKLSSWWVSTRIDHLRRREIHKLKTITSALPKLNNVVRPDHGQDVILVLWLYHIDQKCGLIHGIDQKHHLGEWIARGDGERAGLCRP